MENKPQSERAHELAEFVRGFYNSKIYSLTDYLLTRYDKKVIGGVCNGLADEIESLAEPDGLPYPLDKEGVPIKIGETVYYDKKQGVVVGISLYGCFVNNGTAEVYIKSNDTDIGWKLAKRVTHSLEQRTLDDILQDAEASVYYAKDTGNTVDELIKEAYDLGLSDGVKKNE